MSCRILHRISLHRISLKIRRDGGSKATVFCGRYGRVAGLDHSSGMHPGGRSSVRAPDPAAPPGGSARTRPAVLGPAPLPVILGNTLSSGLL